jgi:hypothetical protein
VNIQQGILNIGVPQPEESPCVCTVTIAWTLVEGQLQGMPVSISITGPITPDALLTMPVTPDQMKALVNDAMGQLAQNMRSEAMKLQPATLADLRNLPPTIGKS